MPSQIALLKFCSAFNENDDNKICFASFLLVVFILCENFTTGFHHIFSTLNIKPYILIPRTHLLRKNWIRNGSEKLAGLIDFVSVNI